MVKKALGFTKSGENTKSVQNHTAQENNFPKRRMNSKVGVLGKSGWFSKPKNTISKLSNL